MPKSPLCHISIQGESKPILDAQQLLLLIIADERSTQGYLHCFEKNTDNEWQPAELPFVCSIGKEGAAWGKGLLDEVMLHGPMRVEGIPQSPLGIFDLGTAFGHAPKHQVDTHWPYLQSTKTHFCVDDPASCHYNQIVDADEVGTDWNSAEEMLRKDGLYEWGVFVHHNSPAQGAAGSCIMLHVWRRERHPTAGCTAMPSEKIKGIITWLKPEAKPKLIQLTTALYPVFQSWLSLPIITDLP